MNMGEDNSRKTSRTHRMNYYQEADINGKLIFNFRDISHTMRFLYEGKGSQKRILIILLETGKITQRALTRRLGIQPGSASEVIAKLEHAGLILRTSSTQDRRTADIELTEAGKERALEVLEQRNKRHEQMFSCLSEREKKQLLGLLERITGDWEERYQDPLDGKRGTEYPDRSHSCGNRKDSEDRE